MGSADFAAALASLLDVGDRQVRIENESRLGGKYDPEQGRYMPYVGSVYVNFINLPTGIGGAGGGAEAENNRMSFWVRGFDRLDPHKTATKVKVEMQTSAFPRSFNMRAKTGTPVQVAKYLAAYINKIAREVPPNFTHTR